MASPIFDRRASEIIPKFVQTLTSCDYVDVSRLTRDLTSHISPSHCHGQLINLNNPTFVNNNDPRWWPQTTATQRTTTNHEVADNYTPTQTQMNGRTGGQNKVWVQFPSMPSFTELNIQIMISSSRSRTRCTVLVTSGSSKASRAMWLTTSATISCPTLLRWSTWHPHIPSRYERNLTKFRAEW